jgi:hypothetical protein
MTPIPASIATMRVLAGLVLLAFVGIVLATNVFRPAPAAERLAGVSVTVAGYTLLPKGSDRKELHLTVKLTSAVNLDECVGFTLDLPFAGRRMATADGTCVRPQAGSSTVELRYLLTEDDLAFPSHTLVWGIPGGRCGLILEAFGVCVVDQAGTAKVELPSKQVLPSIGPLGSFFPLFSFPVYTFPP